MGSCVVVMSGHRCGSTMTVRILSELGVFMNPTSGEGTMEDLALQLLHERAIGYWKEPWPGFEAIENEYREVIRARVESSRLWGFKDPRVCWILKDVVRVIESFNQEVYLINLYRHLVSSAKSLARANPGMAESEARKITEAYHSARQRSLGGYRGKRLDLNYDQMIEHPRREVSRVANFLDIPIKASAIDIIDPSKRNFS